MAEEKREFLRVDDVVPVTYKKVVKPTGWSTDRKGVRKDIGGGGIRLICDEEMPVGTTLELKFDLPDVSRPTSIVVLGEVVWGQRTEEEGKPKYACGVAYVNIDEGERSKIIKYVFDKQRKVKRKAT
ncbi:MAG: hypothetical protein COS84_04990 [Armatimonadetes bacterium CG07_land_8_20_14_0_80_40_9]|nr:MAG: hypothetical protein COS84_04990 [Armatimonadetes bacterium CG07_land_8_20_14_0_80_40_9]